MILLFYYQVNTQLRPGRHRTMYLIHLLGYVVLGNIFNLSKPQFSQVQNGNLLSKIKIASVHFALIGLIVYAEYRDRTVSVLLSQSCRVKACF